MVILQTYIDIHTHTTPDDAAVLSIVSLVSECDSNMCSEYYSLGLHPWYLQNAATDIELLIASAGNSRVLAIGECGLDKVCKTDWELQLTFFRKQIQIANSLNKPLIIHCVKAFEEVINVLDQEKVIVPVVFHGFHKNKILADRLLEKGYYLSFGAAILKEKTLTREVVKAIPSNRFFAETDNSGTSIIDIYQCIAETRKTEVDAIILQIQQNFKSVFIK